MSVLEWKSVELFEIIALPSIKLQNINADITAHCSNTTKSANGTISTTTVLCDKNGFVHIVSANDKPQKPISFKCKNSQQSIKLCSLTTNNILVLLHEDHNKLSICVHVYDLRNYSRKDANLCVYTTIVPTKSAATYIQAEVLGCDKIFALAIGFEKGDILLHVGKMIRDISLTLRPHIIGVSTIYGIQFEDNIQSPDIKAFNMFVASLDGIYCRLINDKGVVEPKIALDNKKNIHSHCCTISQQIGSEPFFVVGRDDAIYCFDRNDRGPCYAIGGEKEFISWIEHHLVVVVKSRFDSVVICVDVVNKIIVFHKRIKNLICMISGINEYYIITKGESFESNCTYNMYKLQEHNIGKKIKLLISKNMLDNALRILERTENADSYNAAVVRLQYGNNLLSRGSFNSAVGEFEQTIGAIKPYEIISKLLYSRHNDNLKQYLNKLVKSTNSTTEQTKLLERCIDRENLSMRIQESWSSRNDSTHICDFKQLLIRDTKFSNLLCSRNQIENMMNVLVNANEQEMLHFFQEYGKEVLLVDSKKVLETFKTLADSRQIKDILPFLMVFSEYEEFCADLLADFLNYFRDRSYKEYYYLLVLYLSLWRANKISSQKIHDYLKQMPFKFGMISILCKAYLFSIETEHQHDSVEQETLSNHEENIEFHIKSNPKLAKLLTVGPRSLLMILDKVCSTPSIQVSDIRSLFTEKLRKSASDAQAELKLIESLKEEIQENGSLLSQFQSNPIEFRNSYCSLCNESLRSPSVYFLCQHSFHKDCLRYHYSATANEDQTVCTLCNENNMYSSVSDKAQIGNSNQSGDVIEGVSHVFATGIVKTKDYNQLTNQLYCQEDVGHNPFISDAVEHSKNPFDDNYDTNFNCY